MRAPTFISPCILAALITASCGSCALGDPCVEYRPQFSWHCGASESPPDRAEPPFEGDLPDIATYGTSAAVDGTWWIADHARSPEDPGREIVFGSDPEALSLALTKNGTDVELAATWVTEPSLSGPDALLKVAVPAEAEVGDEFVLIAELCAEGGPDCVSRIELSIVADDMKFSDPLAVDGLEAMVFEGGCVAECFEEGRHQMRGIQVAMRYRGGPAFLSLYADEQMVRDMLFAFAPPSADDASLAVPATSLTDEELPGATWRLEVRHPQSLAILVTREIAAGAVAPVPLARDDENIANGGIECGEPLDGAECR